jgi:hypothetical protein
MISDEHNFIFIHVPKTGGNSIQKVLLPFSDNYMVPNDPEKTGADRFAIRSKTLDIVKHSSLSDYQRQLDPERFTRYFKTTCIRNPWDRCVSFFFSPHRGSVDWSHEAFETFIQESVKPDSDFLRLSPGDVDPFDNIDLMLRYENLDEDFALLCEKLGIGEHLLPRINVSSRGPYRSYYNDRTIALVASKFALEISRFKYAF